MDLKTFVILHLLDSERCFRDFNPIPSNDVPESKLFSLTRFQKKLEDFVRMHVFPLDVGTAPAIVQELLDEGVFEVRKGYLRLSEDEKGKLRAHQLLHDSTLIFFLENGMDSHPDLVKKAYGRQSPHTKSHP